MLRRRKRTVGTPNIPVSTGTRVEFPANGYFLVDSVLATQENWKQHAEAWFRDAGDAVLGLYHWNIVNDLIILNAKGRVV